MILEETRIVIIEKNHSIEDCYEILSAISLLAERYDSAGLTYVKPEWVQNRFVKKILNNKGFKIFYHTNHESSAYITKINLKLENYTEEIRL